MDDLISRQAAIDALIKWYGCEPSDIGAFENIIEKLPSVQPERLTDDDFETIRIHLNACKEKLCNQQRWEEAEEYQRIIDRFMAFASAQPDLSEYSDKLWRNAYERGKREAQTGTIQCKDCKHDNNCAIQDTARTGNTFFCGAAERWEE